MSSNQEQNLSRRANNNKVAWVARVLLGAGLLLVVVWLALSAFRLVRAGSSLLEQQQRLGSILDAGILNANPDELEEIAVTIREDVLTINQVAGPFTFFGALLGWLPAMGPLLADSQPLLEMADSGSELAVQVISGLKPIMSLYAEGSSGSSLPVIVSAFDRAEPQLVAAVSAAERLFEARVELEHEEQYPGQLLAMLTRLDENADLLNDGLKLALIAPELLGFDRQRTYLIMAQNEDELRPTGGFISGAGVITVDRGRIVGLAFDNANMIDDWENKPYELPPAPFTEFMGMDIFLFRDANFWPDFPTSAAQAMALYSYGQDVPLDGVIAVDQQFLERLLATTGPLSIPELARIVDANSLITQLREEWGPGSDGQEWIIDRKAFLGPLANAFRTQLESGALAMSGFEMVEMLQNAVVERHLQLYVAEQEIADILNETAWSGRIAGENGRDFVHVVDTNMGFNKVNAAVERALSYHVTLDENGTHSAQLEIHYANPPAAGVVECQHGTRYGATTFYDSLTSDCYWNYVRAYVPLGSELLWSSQHPVPATKLMSGLAWPGEARTAHEEAGGLTVFDNFLLLEPRQEATVAFHYQLPDSVLESDGARYNYQLHVRKQAGTAAERALIYISVPDGAEVIRSTPAISSSSGSTLTYELFLTSDARIDLLYRR